MWTNMCEHVDNHQSRNINHGITANMWTPINHGITEGWVCEHVDANMWTPINTEGWELSARPGHSQGVQSVPATSRTRVPQARKVGVPNPPIQERGVPNPPNPTRSHDLLFHTKMGVHDLIHDLTPINHRSPGSVMQARSFTRCTKCVRLHPQQARPG